jgi:hypothetical protein
MQNASCVKSVGTISSRFTYDVQAVEGDTGAGGCRSRRCIDDIFEVAPRVRMLYCVGELYSSSSTAFEID